MKSSFSSQFVQSSTFKVTNTSALSDNLFKRLFEADIPDSLKRFVFLAIIELSISLTLGYLYYTRKGSLFLGDSMLCHIGCNDTSRIYLAKNVINTKYIHLIVNWQEPISEQRKQELIEQANEYVPF